MARDYKNRGRHRTQPKSKPAVLASWWNWLVIVVVIVVFPVLLLKWCGPKAKAPAPTPTQQQTPPQKAAQLQPAETPKPAPEVLEEPRFDFYTILPEKEVVVPEYEIKTRVREERVGKAKASQYMLQAGSFREFADADRLRAKLALMGIEARVEKAQIGTVTWNRVKMGPYAQMSSVTAIKTRLKEHGVDIMVTEIGN